MKINLKNLPDELILVPVLSAGMILSICCFNVLYEIDQSNLAMVLSEEAGVMRETKILFVGDIMLDRGVEFLMNKYGVYYPFEKISGFLREADLVVGNLEGSIVQNPPDFPDESIRFASSFEAIKGLSFANFSLLSLANNHALDMGYAGFEQTENYLKEEGIGFIGHPVNCRQESFYLKGNLAFLAFNKTFSFNCSDDEIAEIVAETKTKNSGKFLIVLIHWGEEYQALPSFYQQKLGREIIDAGADLIVGTHPHVVQKTEEYKGKMIFYSLGNFVFDQYFSEETQKGLIVELKMRSGKPIYELFPIESKLSQPVLQ